MKKTIARKTAPSKGKAVARKAKLLKSRKVQIGLSTRRKAHARAATGRKQARRDGKGR